MCPSAHDEPACKSLPIAVLAQADVGRRSRIALVAKPEFVRMYARLSSEISANGQPRRRSLWLCVACSYTSAAPQLLAMATCCFLCATWRLSHSPPPQAVYDRTTCAAGFLPKVILHLTECAPRFCECVWGFVLFHNFASSQGEVNLVPVVILAFDGTSQ